jgi:hypothetical protein
MGKKCEIMIALRPEKKDGGDQFYRRFHPAPFNVFQIKRRGKKNNAARKIQNPRGRSEAQKNSVRGRPVKRFEQELYNREEKRQKEHSRKD